MGKRTFRSQKSKHFVLRIIRVPLKGLIAASNELPAQGQGLEALWDRFLLRCLVGGIEDMGEFDRMISSTDETEPVVDEQLQITDEEYIRWEKEMAAIKIHYSIFEVIHALKDRIEQYNLQIQNEGGVSSPLYVSDRRWKKMVKLLKASAFLNGSDTIRLSDCTLLSYCLWSEMDQMEAAEEMVNAAIQKSAEGYLLNIKGLEQDIEELKDRQSSEHSLREVNDPGIQVIDTYYYQVEGVPFFGGFRECFIEICGMIDFYFDDELLLFSRRDHFHLEASLRSRSGDSIDQWRLLCRKI